MLLTKLSSSVAGNNMGAVSITDAELTLWNAPCLVEWWRGDFGFSVVSRYGYWAGKKGHAQMKSNIDAAPTQTPNLHNGKTGIEFASTLNNISDPDSHTDLVPAGASYSIMMIARKGATGGNATLGRTSPSTNGLAVLHDSTERWRVRHDAAQTSQNGGTSAITGITDPTCLVYSFDNDELDALMYINGALASTNTNYTIPITATTFGVGGGGTDHFDWLIFNDALHLPRNASILAATYEYAAARYAI